MEPYTIPGCYCILYFSLYVLYFTV